MIFTAHSQRAKTIEYVFQKETMAKRLKATPQASHIFSHHINAAHTALKVQPANLTILPGN